jgi:hypothetical protein
MKKFTVCLVLCLGLIVPANAAVLDEVADLDLTYVVEAVHFGGAFYESGAATSQTIEGVSFPVITATGTVGNVTTGGGAQYCSPDWVTSFAPVDASAPLDHVVSSRVFVSAGGSLTVDIANLANDTYKLQVLLYNGFGDARYLDVSLEGTLVEDNFLQSGATVGDVLTYVVSVTDGTLKLCLCRCGEQSHDQRVDSEYLPPRTDNHERTCFSDGCSRSYGSA